MNSHQKPLYESINLNASGVIEASAGTGKTYTIEHLVLRILTKSKTNKSEKITYPSLENILIVTYTEKAAGELRTRIRKRIEEQIKILSYKKESIYHFQLQHLQRCLQSFDRASIFTIHGFCSYLLKQFPFETKSNWDVEMVDNNALVQESFDTLLHGPWKDRFIQNSLSEFFKSIGLHLSKGAMSKWKEQILEIASQYIPERGDLISPNKEQYLKESSLKTKELLSELKELSIYFQENHIVEAYCKLLGEKFNHETRGLTELKGQQIRKDRIQFLKDLTYHITNIHSLREQTLDPFMEWYSSINLSAFTKSVSLKAVLTPTGYKEEEIISHLEHLLHEKLRTSFYQVLERCDAFFSKISRHLYFIRLSDNWSLYHKCIHELQSHMQIHKERESLITYDDMIIKVYKAFTETNSSLLSILQKRYTYGIVDEFQDTNNIQWNIFKILFEKSKLYLIGDPKQSIYSFQGSDLQVYSRATQELLKSSSETKKYTLDHNYRSSANMIAAYNSLFSEENWFNGETDLPIIYSKVQCGKNIPSYQLHQEIVSKDSSSNLPATPVILKDFSNTDEKLNSAKQQETLNQWIVSEIQELIPTEKDSLYKLPISPNAQTLRSLKHSDICILVPTHKEAQSISQYLTQKKIPHTRYKEKGFLQSKWCVHLILILKAISSPRNTTLQRRALFSIYFSSLLDKMSSEEACLYLEPILLEWNSLAENKQWSVLFYKLQYHSELFRYFQEESLEKKQAIHKQLFHFLFQKASHNNWNLERIIDYLNHLYYQKISIPEDENQYEQGFQVSQVQIMTFHASKGLEFPIVFIAGGHKEISKSQSITRYSKPKGGKEFWLDPSPKINPTPKEKQNALLDDEDRRLYYVALTRAQFRMYLPIFYEKNSSKIIPTKSLKSSFHSSSQRFVSYNIWNAVDKTKSLDLFSFSKISEKKLPINSNSKQSEKISAQDVDDITEVKSITPIKMEKWRAPSPLHHQLRPQTSYSHLVQSGLAVRYNQNLVEYSTDSEHPESGGRVEKEEDTLLKRNFNSKDISGVTQPSILNSNILPKGSHTGSMLHDILEHIPFHKVWEAHTAKELQQNVDILVEIQLHMERYGFSNQYQETIATIIWNTLHAKLPDPYDSENTQGIHLGNLKKYTPEVEFHFNFDSKGKIIRPQNSKGYVLGFIDLIFYHQGRYYILDWKSNYLEDYSLKAIWEDMKDHLYTTQSLLYAVAVHNWLKNIVPNYSYQKHFGGIYYIYLRGIQGNNSQEEGVFTPTGYNAYRPKEEDMEYAFPIEIQKEIRKILRNK
jgi:exodeoxyribonuclease V beta subunit